eukprot:1162088-Pelagomonas_calceolata.AAC.6
MKRGPVIGQMIYESDRSRYNQPFNPMKGDDAGTYPCRLSGQILSWAWTFRQSTNVCVSAHQKGHELHLESHYKSSDHTKERSEVLSIPSRCLHLQCVCPKSETANPQPENLTDRLLAKHAHPA